MKKKNTSIQGKLMRVVMLTCGAVLLLTFAAFFTYEIITYRDITKRQLATLGEVIAANTTSSLAFDNKEDADEILGGLKAQKHLVAACLYDKDGKLFATYPQWLAAKDFPTVSQSDGYNFSGSYLEGYQPVIQESKRLGTLYLKSDLKDVYDRFLLYGLIAVSFSLVALIFAYLLSQRLQKTISLPILKLASTASLVSDGRDYSVRAAKYGEDEVGVLTDAFNHMLTQIEMQNEKILGMNQNLEHKISERTLALEAANTTLTKQKNFIETIIDSSVDLIAVFDKELRFVTLNKKADAIYKRNRYEMIGKPILDVFPSLEGESLIENLKKALSGNLVHDAYYWSIVSNRYFENFFIPLMDENKNINQVLVVAHDITDMVMANEKLRIVNSELEKSNRDLEQFAYVASHDLQEPLRKIQTFSELSERNIEHPVILKRYLEKINSSAARMTDLIKAVLNYSRLSQTPAAFVDIDLNVIIDQIKTDLELLIQEKEAYIETEKLPVISGSPLQMSQLFFNLMSNSLKFSQKKPVIRVTASMVPDAFYTRMAGAKENVPYVQLSFADNGIGFEQKYADQIFSIFQRLHSGADYAGTGIGLAVCKKIVENHGGMITVKSELGAGTIFFIYLPVSDGTTMLQKNKEMPERNLEGIPGI